MRLVLTPGLEKSFRPDLAYVTISLVEVYGRNVQTASVHSLHWFDVFCQIRVAAWRELLYFYPAFSRTHSRWDHKHTCHTLSWRN
jgi:hypothetical protein